MLNKIINHFQDNEEGYGILIALSIIVLPLVLVHVFDICQNFWHY